MLSSLFHSLWVLFFVLNGLFEQFVHPFEFVALPISFFLFPIA